MLPWLGAGTAGSDSCLITSLSGSGRTVPSSRRCTFAGRPLAGHSPAFADDLIQSGGTPCYERVQRLEVGLRSDVGGNDQPQLLAVKVATEVVQYPRLCGALLQAPRAKGFLSAFSLIQRICLSWTPSIAGPDYPTV